ncbi:hypothetical protein MVEG_05255 [Podila verticillata NRRL 6337]|nr:hypothetical protein MVEG_05255 [Podila verticillata NRRL 6337]
MKRKKLSPFEYMIIASVALLAASIAKYPNRAVGTRSRPDLKGKKEWPIIGNLITALSAKQVNLTKMQEAFDKYGNVYTFTVPFRGRFIMVNDPLSIEHVLKNNFNNYIKGRVFSHTFKDILGQGIFVSDQDAWRFHRKTAANIFTTRLYRQLVNGAFKDTARDLCQVLDRHDMSSTPVDLQQNFLKLTLDAFGKLTFGIQFNALLSEGPNEFGDAFDYLTSNIDGRVVNPFWFIADKLTPGKPRKLREAVAILEKYAARAVSQRRNETPGQAENRARDLLDHFIKYQDDGAQLDDNFLKDVFANFMVAGRDTTALTLTWQFYSLLANPRVLKNLLHELEVVLQGSDEFTYEGILHELPYLKAVFHETLRLYPQVPRNAKESIDDDVLPDGTVVHAGDIVGFSNWCMGRSKAVWGEDAALFVPERWLVDEELGSAFSSQTNHNHNKTGTTTTHVSPFGKFKMENQFKFNSFNSFNASPRLCLGQTFATLEAMVTTCILLQNFTFELLPGQKPEPKGSATLPMAKPLMVMARRRPTTSRYQDQVSNNDNKM